MAFSRLQFFKETTKKELFQIAFAFALQLTGRESFSEAVKILEKERELVRLTNKGD